MIGTGSVQVAREKVGEPANAVTTIVDWQTKHFDWSWTVIYDGPTKVNPNNPASKYQYYRIGTYVMANTSLGFTVNDHFKLRAIINNPFGLGVSYAGPTPQFSTNKQFDAVFGRNYRVSAEIKF